MKTSDPSPLLRPRLKRSLVRALPPAALVLSLAAAGSVPARAVDQPQIVFETASPFSPLEIEEVATMDLDGGGRVQRTSDEYNRFLPHFSPDGTRLVYTTFLTGSYGDPTSVTAITVYDRATGRETVLDPSGQPVVSIATPTSGVWSPDGGRIAFTSRAGDGLWIMNADGSANRLIARPGGTQDDSSWGDPLWSNDGWIYFTVAQNIGGNCFKVRIDRIRPDGSQRTKITDGGPNCTPQGFEQNGDADPGISPDGKTIYSSRGLPRSVPGLPQATVRHLYSFSSDPWTPGKQEVDLSATAKSDCIAGVPKVSPDGTGVLLYLFCSNDRAHAGITLTDPAGSFWKFLSAGFGSDWNPVGKNAHEAPVPPQPRVRPCVVSPR